MRHLVVWALAGVAAIVVVACGGSRPAHSATASPATGAARTASAPSPAPGINRSAVSPAGNAADWPTYHRQPARAGVAAAGPALGRVHRVWSAGVDGAVYAEPLVAGGRVIVATENDSVYAFDATTGREAWRAHLGTPVSGGELPCGNIDVSGITSTPVIDPTSGVVYVVTFQRFEHRLVALDLATGAVRWQRRIDPPGADPRTHQQRAALALSHARVYVAYGGLYGDCGDYHGWVLGAPASGPTGGLLGYRVPAGREGGIWAPSGPALDGAGNLYVATGNGSSTSSFDFGNAVIRLTPTLRRSGFFAPTNAAALSGADLDLGSTGPVLLPDGRGASEVWVVVPDRPVHSVVVFGHGWKLTPPPPAHSWVRQFRPWLDHLAAGGSAIIFPRYQLGVGDTQDASRVHDFANAIHTGYALLGRPRVPIVAVGYSFGASLAFYYSANAAAWRLPLPSAVQAVFPGGMVPGAPLSALNRTVRVLIQVGDADTEAGSAGANAFWTWLATHPSSRKRYQVVRSSPELAATHAAPKSAIAAAQRTFWAPLDRLIAQARTAELPGTSVGATQPPSSPAAHTLP